MSEDLPDQVRATVLGHEVVGDVAERIWRPSYNGGEELLRVAVDGTMFRVPIAQTDHLF